MKMFKKIFFSVLLVAGILFSTGAYAADLTINSMADITANCPYDSGSRTYSCTGWDNVHTNNDLTIPVADCWYDRRCRDNGQLIGCNPNNIIFKVNNEFSAKNFYVSSAGGKAGSLTIEAKKITADSLNAAGTACSSSSCRCSQPYCYNSDGGDVTLKADTVNVGTINANQGGGANGSGGKVSITASSTTVTNIYSSGGGYTCSYDYGYDNGAGSGGSVVIKSGTASVSSISLNGAGRNYAYGGTGAGSAKISANTLSLGTINANGASGSQGQGSGGNIKIYADSYSLTSISASGPNGYIAFFTDGIFPHKGEYYGGTATLEPFSPPSGKSGGCDSYYDSGKRGTAWSWPNTAGYTICNTCSWDSNPCVGCSTYTNSYWYNACYSAGGYTCAGKSGCCSPTNPYYNPSDGKCYQTHIILNAATFNFGKRTGSGFFVFETNIPSQFVSYRAKLKDFMGQYVKSIYNVEWSQVGAIKNGKISDFMGAMTKMNIKIGNDYTLELTASPDAFFDETKCAGRCATYAVPFNVY